MKADKQCKVKYSPVFAKQLIELKQAISEKELKFHKQLLLAIEREVDNLFQNPQRGIQIEKKKIPQSYVQEYGASNLWKINLPDYWRMLYTIVGSEVEIVSVLLEFMDHKQCNKLLGYKKK